MRFLNKEIESTNGCLCVCVCACVRACVRACIHFSSLLFLSSRRWHMGFKIWIAIHQIDFTDWMHFLPSKMMEKISHNPEDLSANT